jgi:predicted ATPase
MPPDVASYQIGRWDLGFIPAKLNFCCEKLPSACEKPARSPVARASDLIELSNRQNFAPFLRRAAVLRGRARSTLGDPAEGVSWIEDGIGNYRATGSMLDMPFLVALKAEALHLADRTSDALEAITEVEALIESFENRYWCAELHRLRGVFLTALGADQSQIEAALCEAIRIAKEQKSV